MKVFFLLNFLRCYLLIWDGIFHFKLILPSKFISSPAWRIFHFHFPSQFLTNSSHYSLSTLAPHQLSFSTFNFHISISIPHKFLSTLTPHQRSPESRIFRIIHWPCVNLQYSKLFRIFLGEHLLSQNLKHSVGYHTQAGTWKKYCFKMLILKWGNPKQIELLRFGILRI